MPVGDDVVDLRHPYCQPDAIHPRFDIRAFSADEIDRLAAADSVHRMRWSLWAAKESAFKAARKLDPRVRFIPRDFSVRLNGERARVIHRSGRFDVWLDHTENWVHASASQSGEKPGLRLEGDPAADPSGEDESSSDRVRKLARTALGAVLDIAPAEVEIVTTKRIPSARRLGEPLPLDLSLSHDGRFVSCVWQLTGPRRPERR